MTNIDKLALWLDCELEDVVRQMLERGRSIRYIVGIVEDTAHDFAATVPAEGLVDVGGAS